MLGRRLLPPLEGRDDRQPQSLPHALGQQLSLIEAPLAPSLRVDGHRHQDVAADPGPPPPRRHEHAERLGEATLAVVLEGMHGTARRAGERGAPFLLHDPVGERRG
jgi:hypothetical protein